MPSTSNIGINSIILPYLAVTEGGEAIECKRRGYKWQLRGKLNGKEMLTSLNELTI